MKQNLINHVALVLDASGSMNFLSSKVITVGDQLIKHLARKSTELDQETRVTVYIFDDTAQCVIFDKDVLRLPSLKDLYRIGGMTALRDATLLSIDDLRKTAQMYGDHAFLTYVLTDGEENASYKYKPDAMEQYMHALKDNETLAALVPNENGRRQAIRAGFPEGNITVWEVSVKGLEDAGTNITRSVDTYMSNRVLGVRSTKSVFSTDTEAVNTKTVNSKNLTPLPRDAYYLVDVKASTPSLVIREFVEEVTGIPYQIGKAFYQLTKTEIIQTNKQLAIQNIHSGRVYTGQEARDVLGLPAVDARVKPDHNDKYRIFVQSTSVNRKLVAGTKLLLMK